VASVSEFISICSALILNDNKVMVTENKISALIKAAEVNLDPFWPGLCVKALANVNIGSVICNAGAGGPAGSWCCTSRRSSVSIMAAPAKEKKVEAKKEDSKESDDDMGFGLSD
ncbi:RLA1 protein, partial [Crocuta crocuta]